MEYITIRDLFTSWKQINEDVTNKNAIYAFDSVIDSIAPIEQQNSASKIFVSLMSKALIDYNKFFPMPFKMVFSTPKIGKYIFLGNFELYLRDKLPDSSLILVPKSILTVNGGRAGMRALKYTKNILWADIEVKEIEAMVELPSHFEINEAGELSDNSGIYGDLDYDRFFTIFCLHYFNYLKSERDLVKISIPVDTYGNIDELLSTYTDRWDVFVRTNAQPLALWGMRKY